MNAAVTAWLLLGPLLLLATRWPSRGRRGGRRRAPGPHRALAALASLWWIVPVAAHARYGLNFLPFTESPGAIWDTTSLSESFRLFGYWIAYLGTGYGTSLVPYFDTAGTVLFDPLTSSPPSSSPRWPWRASRGRDDGATGRSSWGLRWSACSR